MTDVDPKVGRAGGNTKVLITGRGFRSYKNVLCRFGENMGKGSFTAQAEVIDDERLTCLRARPPVGKRSR